MKKLITQFAVCFTLLFALASCKNEVPQSNETNNVAANQNSETPAAPTPAEEPQSEKKALLSSIVGKYTLSHIDGVMGMNSMFEYSKEMGEWSATGSDNVGGERESYDLDVDAYAWKVLESMVVVVKEDLSIEISADNTTYIKIPYKDKGMSYQLSKASTEYSSISGGFDANTTVKEDYLYISVSDKEDISTIGAIDIAGISANSYLLRYNKDNDSFVLDLFLSDGTDVATYLFV